MFNSLALANSKIGQLTIKLARLEKRMGLGGVIGVPTGHIEMATPKTLSTPISTNIHIYIYRYKCSRYGACCTPKRRAGLETNRRYSGGFDQTGSDGCKQQHWEQQLADHHCSSNICLGKLQ